MNIDEQLEAGLNFTFKYQYLEPYYSTFHYIVFLFALIATIFSAHHYLFNRKVQMSEEFRVLMWHYLLSSFIYSINLMCWQPILMSKLFGVYSVGIWDYFGVWGGMISIWVSSSTFDHLNILITIFFGIRYFRICNVKQRHLLAFFEWLITRNGMSKFLNSLLIFNYFITILPVLNLQANALDLKKFQTEHNLPHLLVVIAPNSGLIFIAYRIMSQIVFFIEIALCLLGLVLIYFYIKTTTGIVTQKTVRMQARLYKIFLARLLITVLFFYFPYLIIASSFLPDTGDYPLQMIRICLMSLHCPLQALVTVFGQPTSRKITTVVSLTSRA